ncbi:MAG TPA: hypothetical protein VGN48_04650 [Pedococcus sp.]|jgi:hypothetical protein|nr:hypothetical protein [Pedococcus sp.]
MTDPPPGAQISMDGAYWWDDSTQQWQPMRTGQSSGQLSEDGNYRWDGSAWQPVHADAGQQTSAATPGEQLVCKAPVMFIQTESQYSPSRPYVYEQEVEGSHVVEVVGDGIHGLMAAKDLAEGGYKFYKYAALAAEGADAAAADAVLTEALASTGAGLVGAFLIIALSAETPDACCALCPTCWDGIEHQGQTPEIDAVGYCDLIVAHAGEHHDEHEHVWVGEPHSFNYGMRTQVVGKRA